MKIVVINPNSSGAMTEDIRVAAEKYAAGRCETLVLPTDGAPEFIDTFEDAALAAPGMMRLVRQYEQEADAFVIACACDPNLLLLRELSSKPVIGIGQASMYYASQIGNSFAILQTDSYSVPNKRNLVREYQMERYLAGVDVAAGQEEDVFYHYQRAGQMAIQEQGAEVIILGCAGLCTLAHRLSQALGVPVLDGVACGIAMAESMVHLGYSTSKARYYSGGKNG